MTPFSFTTKASVSFQCNISPFLYGLSLHLTLINIYIRIYLYLHRYLRTGRFVSAKGVGKLVSPGKLEFTFKDSPCKWLLSKRLKHPSKFKRNLLKKSHQKMFLTGYWTLTTQIMRSSGAVLQEQGLMLVSNKHSSKPGWSRHSVIYRVTQK